MEQSCGTSSGEAVYKVEGGKLVKVVTTSKENTLLEIRITGDFFLHPEDAIEKLENILAGKALADIPEAVRQFFEREEVQMIGIGAEDIIRAVNMSAGLK